MYKNFKLNLDGAEWKIRQALTKNEGFIKTIYETSVNEIIQDARLYGQWHCENFAVKYNNKHGIDHFEIWE